MVYNYKEVVEELVDSINSMQYRSMEEEIRIDKVELERSHIEGSEVLKATIYKSSGGKDVVRLQHHGRDAENYLYRFFLSYVLQIGLKNLPQLEYQ